MQEASKDFRLFFKKQPMKNDNNTDFHCSRCGSVLNLVYSQLGKAYFSCANWERCGEIFPAYCDITRKVRPNYNVDLKN